MAGEQPGQLEQLANEHEKLHPYKDAFRQLDKEVNQKLNDINNKAESFKEKPWYKRWIKWINKIRGRNEPNLTPDQFKRFSDDIKNKIQERYSKFVDTVNREVLNLDKYPVSADMSIKDATERLKKGLSSLIDEEVRLAAVAAGRTHSANRFEGTVLHSVGKYENKVADSSRLK